MMAQPLALAIRAARARQQAAGIERPPVVCLSPQGELLDHAGVAELAVLPGMILVAGRYEGIDERLMLREIDREISIGDYVLSGGELGALVLIDAVVRQLPGVLNDSSSAGQDSFVGGLLDWPHYTRPEVFEGMEVPAVLMSGHHAEIERWRRKQALGRTLDRRPDLLDAVELDRRDRALLDEYARERTTTGSRT